MDDRAELLTELTLLAGAASVAEGTEEGWRVEYDVELVGELRSVVVDLAAWRPGVAVASSGGRPRPDWVVVIERPADLPALAALAVPRAWVVGDRVHAFWLQDDAWSEAAEFARTAILAQVHLL